MGKIRNPSAAEMFSKLEMMKRQYVITPLPILEQTIQNVQLIACAKLDEEMAKKEKNFLEKHAGEDWWQLATLQYPITETADGFTVTSKIVDREFDRQWSFTHKYLAMAKVYQLVHWVHLSRTRGFGDMDVDLERWSTIH